MPQFLVAPALVTRLSSIVALQPPAAPVTAGVTCAPPETVQLYGAAWMSARLAYVFLSAKYDSCAEARFFRSDFIWAMYAFSFVFANFGIAIAARMPMITTTIRSSMSEKPLRLLVRMTRDSGVGGTVVRGGTARWFRVVISAAPVVDLSVVRISPCALTRSVLRVVPHVATDSRRRIWQRPCRVRHATISCHPTSTCIIS